jgi:hypothetical protein
MQKFHWASIYLTPSAFLLYSRPWDAGEGPADTALSQRRWPTRTTQAARQVLFALESGHSRPLIGPQLTAGRVPRGT